MMNLVHYALIILHTVAGTISFIAGLLVVILRRTSWLFEGYLWSLVVMAISVVMVVIWDWPVLTLPQQISYTALGALGIYTSYRGFQARQKQAYRYTGWRLEFMEDVGFTLISLFDAFVIIGAIDLGMPIWGVVVLGAVGIIAGRKWIQYEKQRYISDRKRYNEKKLRKG